jgi:N-acylneuraminate cytidylyltransferase
MISLILARGGSKSIPKKNIKLLGGKPLITHVIDSVSKTKYITDIFVSTDCDEISEISKKAGTKIIKRPDYLAQDDSKDIDSFIHALDFIGECEEIAQFRATTPLINPDVLNNAISHFYENKNMCTSMRSAHETTESVIKFYTQKNNYFSPICDCQDYKIASELPRQSLSKTYNPNGYIDIVKPKVFLYGKTLYGEKILSFITESVIEIDSIEEFNYLEYTYNSKLK